MLYFVFPLQMIMELDYLQPCRKNLAVVILFPAMHTSRENHDLNSEVRTN